MTQRIVINRCFGGFGLSDAAYEKLIEWGIPARRYIEEQRNPTTGLCKSVEANEGEIIFDRDLTPPEERDEMVQWMRHQGRYWETWTEKNRAHPLLVCVVQELGKEANGQCADLTIVEIPDGVEWEIQDYDGREYIAEKHRTWP